MLILGFQIALILCIGATYLAMFGWFKALAIVYGGSMAVFSAWMLMKRIRLATKTAREMPGREMGILYIGAIQRFVLVLVLFAIGMAILKLDPVSLLIGFAVPQGVFLLGAYFYGVHSSNQDMKEVAG